MQIKLWVLLSILLAGSVTLVRGQYTIVPLAVSPVYMKGQLWNLTVSNTGTTAVQARIQMDMKDIQTRQSVMSAISTSFRLAPGSSMVQMQALEPIQYSYSSPAVVDRNPNGILPVGQYQVCYQLMLSFGENQTAVADDCEEVAVEPLSPPLLTMPENDSVLTTLRPNFTWVPPAPVTMFSDLTYDVLISEVNDGQSITDAIQKNLPLQQAQGLSQPFLSFPMQGPQLEDGKTYAWQVIARDQQRFGAKSEVWSFKTTGIKDSPIPGNSVYAVMDGRAGSTSSSDSSVLHVKYVSSSATYSSAVWLKDEKGNVLMTSKCEIRQGDNYLDIPLNGSFQRKQYYNVALQDKTGRTISLPFSIK